MKSESLFSQILTPTDHLPVAAPYQRGCWRRGDCGLAQSLCQAALPIKQSSMGFFHGKKVARVEETPTPSRSKAGTGTTAPVTTKKNNIDQDDVPSLRQVAMKSRSVQQWKKNMKMDRKKSSKLYESKQTGRSSRIQALVDQRHAHQSRVLTHNKPQEEKNQASGYDPMPSKAKTSWTKATNIGFNTAMLASQNMFHRAFGKK